MSRKQSAQKQFFSYLRTHKKTPSHTLMSSLWRAFFETVIPTRTQSCRQSLRRVPCIRVAKSSTNALSRHCEKPFAFAHSFSHQERLISNFIFLPECKSGNSMPVAKNRICAFSWRERKSWLYNESPLTGNPSHAKWQRTWWRNPLAISHFIFAEFLSQCKNSICVE